MISFENKDGDTLKAANGFNNKSRGADSSIYILKRYQDQASTAQALSSLRLQTKCNNRVILSTRSFVTLTGKRKRESERKRPNENANAKANDNFPRPKCKPENETKA